MGGHVPFPAEHDRPTRHTLVHELPVGMRVQAEMLAVADDTEDK
jgi:hypothetical protein